jgi:adenylate cyclase
MTVLSVLTPPFLQALDFKIYDAFQHSLPRGGASAVPVIVDIDEDSLRRYGQWPWPRYLMARLLGKINDSRAASVALDIIFAEPDRTSLSSLKEELEREFDIQVEVPGGEFGEVDNDAIFAETLKSGPYVLSSEFIFEGDTAHGRGCVLHPLQVANRQKPGRKEGRKFFVARDVICNIDVLSRAVTSSGFFNATADRDGVIRRVPMIIEYEGRRFPGLALASIMKAGGVEQVVIEEGISGRFLVVRERRIPLDEMGNLLLRFRGGARTFSYISAADVLDGNVPAGALDGKIVFIGTTAAGLQEIRTSPVEVKHPGPEIHATAVDNVLSGRFNIRTRLTRLIEALLVFLLGGVAALTLVRLRAVLSLAFISAGVALLWAGANWLFVSSGLYVSPLMPSLALILSFTVVESLERWEEEKKVKARTREFVLAQEAIIRSMASLAETRDSETGGHILRTQHYVRALALHLQSRTPFDEVLDDNTVDMLFKVAPLHDVGKVGVRDSVLLKPDKLSPEEFEEMKKHTTYATSTLQAAEDHLGGNRFLHLALEVAESHQEWWDGTGYPLGLAGDDIPLSGRIMAVADVYDALISRRRYKDAYNHEEAVEIMRQERSAHFDPRILDAFLEIQQEFRQIAARFTDADPD